MICAGGARKGWKIVGERDVRVISSRWLAVALRHSPRRPALPPVPSSRISRNRNVRRREEDFPVRLVLA